MYVAWQGGAVTIEGTPYAFATGTRLRGYRVVRLFGPEAFVLDGTPADEMPSVFDEMVRRSDEAGAAAASAEPGPSIDPATTLADLRICVRAVLHSTVGTIQEGSIVTATDPRVEAVPEVFDPLERHLRW